MQKTLTIIALLAGLALLLLALLLVLPVAVNLPDSWVGGTYIVILAFVGMSLFVWGKRRLMHPKVTQNGAH